jgi:uncharacterized pyridoxamine 5'-phosphate oxidase family protein
MAAEGGYMNELLELLEGSPVGALATKDGGVPRVRPFQFMFAEDGRLWFCTSSEKRVFAQLKADPSVEFLATRGTSWARVAGVARFLDDLKAKDRILSQSDLVRSIYKSAANPIFRVFAIEDWTATVSDFSGRPPRAFSA